MRELKVAEITAVIRRLCIETNRVLPQDLETAVGQAERTETSGIGKAVLEDLRRNLQAAKEMQLPICQDTGMAVVFLEIGQEVHLTGGDLTQAVNEGVRQGYTEGLLRLSVVGDPLERRNTNDNTP